MKVVTLASVKGGVGKTTAAVNLARVAAEQKQRVLLWDLDPQGAATFALRIGARAPGGARRLFEKRSAIDNAVVPSSVRGLDVVPADFSLRHLDLELSTLGKPRRRVDRSLATLADRYDVAFLDCPPGITLAIESALRATDVLLVPIVPSELPLRGFDLLSSYVAAEKPLRKVQVLGFPSMVDRRKKSHRELSEQLMADRPAVLPAAVPLAVAIERIGEAGPVADCWRELADQLAPCVDGAPNERV